MVNRCGIFKYSGNFVFIHLIIHYHFIKIIVFLVNSGAHNCDLKFHKAVLGSIMLGSINFIAFLAMVECHFRSRSRPQRYDEVRIRPSHCRQVKEYPRPCPGCQRKGQCEHQKEGEQQSQSDKEQQYGYDDIFQTGEVAYFVIHEHPVVSDSISSPLPNAKNA